MATELKNDAKSKINNNNNNLISKEHMNTIKANLLNPTEVTFCDLSDSNLSSKRISREIDSDSIISSVNYSKKKYEIPDGGYGWVVVMASFVVSLIADGVSFSFGLLYTQFIEHFKESESKTSWIGSLFLSIPLLVGPIMSNLVDTYGCRRMTMIGGLVAGSGFVLAALSNSVEMLCLTFGVIGGLGLGVGYVTAVVSIAFWFDKKRTFATGIGASGTGIGTFLYAPLTQWLIENYGWRSTILILAGTMFHICVCGALMRDPDWLIEENRLESRSQSMQTFSNSSVCLDEIKKLLDSGVRKEDVLETLVTNYNTEANQQITAPDHLKNEKKYASEVYLPTFVTSTEFDSIPHLHGSWRSLRTTKKQNQDKGRDLFIAPNPNVIDVIPTHLASSETLNPSEKESYFDNQTVTNSVNSSLTDLQRRFSLDENYLNHDTIIHIDMKIKGVSLDAMDDTLNVQPNNILLVPNANNEIVKRNKSTIRKFNKFENGNLKRNLSLRNSHYFRNMRIHRNSIHYRGAMLNTHRYRLRASSCPNIYRNSMTTIAREEDEKWYDNFIDIIKSIFDFSLFLDLKFFFFNLSTLFLFIWFIVPYFYITAYLLQQADYNYTEEDGAFFISLVGIFQMFGMIALGWFGDRPNVNVPKCYGICLCICGISVGLMPIVAFNYPALLLMAIVFGITFASSFSFTPIIIVSLVDLDDFTCAYGLVLLVQGIGNLIGPPLASFIFVQTGRWDESFYAGGICIILSGFLVYITGILQERDNVERKKKLNQFSNLT